MIYEMRTYTLKPGTVPEFETRFAQRHPYREKHSKLGRDRKLSPFGLKCITRLRSALTAPAIASGLFPAPIPRVRTALALALASGTPLRHGGYLQSLLL